MTRPLLTTLLVLMPFSVLAADTAYTALRLVGKRGGEDSLSRVLEVRGKMGAPEPQMWKVTLIDPAARAGVHEYEVQRGRITGERAPSGHPAGDQALDLGKLNIDSDGAFTIANQEAQKAGQPFDRVDYTLRNGGRGVAVWHLELFNGRNGRVGEMEIAADAGTLLRHDFHVTGPAPRGPAADDQAYLRDHPIPDAGPGVDDEELGPGITDIFGKIGRHFEKRGRQIKSFFSH